LRIQRYDETDSTNERALASLAAGEARDGDVHVALQQTQGRGRRGRPWISPPGSGLYLSFVHLPEAPAPRPEAVTVAAGLALRDAVHALGAREARLKWPNDLMHSGAKLAGILVESRGFRPEAPHFVIGTGLNVAQETFPAELEAERAVTSLKRIGVDASLAAAQEALLEHLPERLLRARSAPEPLFEEYVDAAGLSAGVVTLTSAAGSWSGRVKGVVTGAVGGFEIELVLASGERRRFPLAHVQALRAES